MTIRSDIAIDWSVSPRLIEVAAPSVLLTCQDLHDTLRHLAAQENAIDEPEIVDSSGKEALGLGIAVGLTVKLLDAKVRFQARPGPDTVQCVVYNGTLVTDDGSTPLAPSAYTSVVAMNQVGGVIATGSGDVDAIAAGVWNRQETEIGTNGSIGRRVKLALDVPVSTRAMPGESMELTVAERLAVADAVLLRGADNVEKLATTKQCLVSALLKLTSKFNALSGVTYESDGVTPHMTQTPVTDVTMKPIRELGRGE